MLSLLSKFRIHPLFWLVIGVAIITARFWELLMLFSIVFVHEMGHVLSAYFFSWKIKRIELLPFGGVAEMDEHGNRPLKEELIVILSGPLQHVWLVSLAYLLFSLSVISEETFHLFVMQNAAVFIFNLLPIWPLDGGKLLFLFLSFKYPFSQAHKQMIYISIGSLILLMAGYLFYQPFHLHFWVIFAFLVFSIIIEWRQRHYVFMRFLLERYYGKKLSVSKLKPIIVQDQETIFNILLKFQRGHKHPIIIQKEKRNQHQLDENELLHAFFTEKRKNDSVSELLYFY
jgi:stage IV sporulation protein FB